MKQQDIATKFSEDTETNYQAAMRREEQKEKQLRDIYKRMHTQWIKFKDDNASTMNKMAHLKQEETYKL